MPFFNGFDQDERVGDKGVAGPSRECGVVLG